MVVMEHMKGKLEVPAYEWRRILKVNIKIVKNHLELTSYGVSFEGSPSQSLTRLEEWHVQDKHHAELHLLWG